MAPMMVSISDPLASSASGSNEDDEHCEYGREQKPYGVAQLVEGGARDHVLDFGEGVVGSHATRVGDETEPNAAASALDGPSQRAIVDDLVADGSDSAGTLERSRPDEDATSGGAGGLAPRIANPSRRIQQKEKEDEGRDQKLLRQVATMELHHERSEIVAAVLCDRDQSREAIGRVFDIGVGQQEKVGTELGSLFDSLLHRPQLSGPSWRQRTALDYAGATAVRAVGRGAADRLGRSITAVVVDHKNLERFDTALVKQRGD